MKLSTTRENLLSAIQTLTSPPKKSALPIIQSILVTIDCDNNVTLHGTDLENHQETPLGCWSITAGAGRAMIDPKQTTPILKALPKDTQIDLSWEKNYNETKLTIFSLTPNNKTAQVSISMTDGPEVYPFLPALKYPTQSTTIPLAPIIEKLKTCLSYVSVDELRPQICGVLFEVEPDKISLTATNGHILHHTETPANTKFNDAKTSYSFIASGQTLKQLLSAIGKISKKNRSETLEIWASFSEENSCPVNLVEFSCGGFRHIAKPVEGRYPNYNAVLPSTPETGILYADPEEVDLAVSGALPLCNECEPRVKLSLNGSVSLKVENIGDGRSSDCELSSCHWVRHNPDSIFNTDQFDIGFNPHYIRTIFNSFNTDRLLLELRTPRSAVIAHTPANPDRFSLLMPVDLTK